MFSLSLALHQSTLPLHDYFQQSNCFTSDKDSLKMLVKFKKRVNFYSNRSQQVLRGLIIYVKLDIFAVVNVKIRVFCDVM
jgi:hypothetical protein